MKPNSTGPWYGIYDVIDGNWADPYLSTSEVLYEIQECIKDYPERHRYKVSKHICCPGYFHNNCCIPIEFIPRLDEVTQEEYERRNDNSFEEMRELIRIIRIDSTKWPEGSRSSESF